MTQIKFNVAQLLREPVGARREYSFSEEALPLDESLTLRDIRGEVQFTRTASGVFVRLHSSGVVRLVCVRSLEEFDQQIVLHIEDEFHAVVDVISGMALQKPTAEDPFFLDELHMADVGELIREYTLLELPLSPVSEAYRDQPVQYTAESADDETAAGDEAIDARLEALKRWKEKNQE